MNPIDEFSSVQHMPMAAVFSPCRLYRYALVRNFYEGTLFSESPNRIAFIGLNPSVADEERNDPTITRLINFAKHWGYSGMFMLNAFAWIDTNRLRMLKVPEPVGEHNDAMIRHICKQAQSVCACWGNEGRHRGRHKQLETWLPMVTKVDCFCLNSNGTPGHPLYLRSDTQRITLWEKQNGQKLPELLVPDPESGRDPSPQD